MKTQVLIFVVLCATAIALEPEEGKGPKKPKELKTRAVIPEELHGNVGVGEKQGPKDGKGKPKRAVIPEELHGNVGVGEKQGPPKDTKRNALFRRAITNPSQFFNSQFCSKYPAHSACARSGNPSKEGVNAEMKNLILKEHNEFRSSQLLSDGQPAPANMQKMYWDVFAEYVAQKHASACVYKHDKNENRNIPGYISLGQNIAYGQADWSQADHAWYGEEKDFLYGQGSTGGEVGHYTQIVWAKTNRIGCGFAQCSFGPFYVCNYGPAGNMIGKQNTPYEKSPTGQEASACPSQNKNGLCDCKGLRCHAGSIDVKTCTCKCPNKPYYSGDSCKLDCNKATDVWWCSQYSKPSCKDYSNFPVDCPKMCGLCSTDVVPNIQGLANAVTDSGPLPTNIKTPSITTTTENKNTKCSKIDDKTCNQPDSGPYWAKSYCSSGCQQVKSLCPAMCGECQATACKDNHGNTKQIGQSWVGSMGKYTCKTDGVTWTKGCVYKGEFYAAGSTTYKTVKETYWGHEYEMKYKYECIQHGNSLSFSMGSA